MLSRTANITLEGLPFQGMMFVVNPIPGCAAARRPWALEYNAFGVKAPPHDERGLANIP